MLSCRSLNSYRQGKKEPVLVIETTIQDCEVPLSPVTWTAQDPGENCKDCRGMTGMQNRNEAGEKAGLSHHLLNE